MATHEHDQDSIPAGARQFVTTRWTIVLNAGGTDKKRFVSRLFAIDYNGALGRFSFDKNGDSTLTDYGVYKVGPSGDPVFSKVIKGPK